MKQFADNTIWFVRNYLRSKWIFYRVSHVHRAILLLQFCLSVRQFICHPPALCQSS